MDILGSENPGRIWRKDRTPKSRAQRPHGAAPQLSFSHDGSPPWSCRRQQRGLCCSGGGHQAAANWRAPGCCRRPRDVRTVGLRGKAVIVFETVTRTYRDIPRGACVAAFGACVAAFDSTMAEPMSVDRRHCPIKKYTRTPQHIKKFGNVPGCGKAKLRALASRFATAAALDTAAEADFCVSGLIGKALAAKLYAVKSGTVAADHWNGEQRVVMWNKVSCKKVAGAAAPRASDVDAWLSQRSTTHERYAGQDLAEKGPFVVPEADQIEDDEFESKWKSESVRTVDEALAALPQALNAYGLKAFTLPSAAATSPDFGSLHFALLHAAANIDGDVDALHCVLQATVDGEPLTMLDAAYSQLKRPIWVWMCCSGAGPSSSNAPIEASVFHYDGGDEHDPQQVTPIRIACAGTRSFAVTTLENVVEVGVDLQPVGGADTIEHAQLPDLKEDVDRALADALAQLDAIETWSNSQLAESYDLSTTRQTVDDLRERLISGGGQDAALLGTNGAGKSTIGNLLILNSSIDEVAYTTRAPEYVPEGLRNIWTDKREPPTSFQQLLEAPATSRNVNVTLLPFETSFPGATSFDEAVELANSEYAKTEESIKGYCEKPGSSPQLTRFVLPSGEPGRATTALHTRVLFGSVVHLLVEFYSADELKKLAFKFVTLLKHADGESVRTMDKLDRDALVAAWHVYLNVKQGPYTRENLPRLKDLPKMDDVEKRWQEITIGPEMQRMIDTRYTLYLGSGKSLHLDRIMVHDVVKLMNHKEQLYRYAVKSLDNFQPAAVLEGGNGFIDLPGLNDEDSGCMVQTHDGIKDAGVVFVVLKKSLYEDKDSLDLLRDSETIKRAAAGEANVVFLFNREPEPNYQHGQLDTEYERKAREELELHTRTLWRKELLEANEEAEEYGDPFKTVDEIKELAANTPMRAIYPMLHSSYKLNWQYAESHKETEGDVCGSKRTFELSNVNWQLGILETINRQGLVEQLKHIATTIMPALREKLNGDLANAKNAKGGLATELVDRAAKFLKSKRLLDGQIGIVAQQLEDAVHSLGAINVSVADSSFRMQIDALVKHFVMEGEEVSAYLDKGREASVKRWADMARAMKRAHQAVNTVDPRNKGNYLGFRLMPMIFGNNSRHVPFSFERLVADVSDKLDQMLEKVIDLVIAHVDTLIGADATALCTSTVILRESFLASDVIAPLQARFSLPFFIKTKQRDPLLIDGKLDTYLKKSAAQLATKAVHSKMLARCDEQSIVGIKTFIESSRDVVRDEWRELVGSRFQDFFGEQFRVLIDDLTAQKKKTIAFSLKSMLVAFLQHIVNTDKMQRNIGLQQELSGFIRDVAFKTDSLRSLWARLDGQDDPDKLGAAAARHLERRRLRELTKRRARVTFTLGTPDRTMPVTDLTAAHRAREVPWDIARHLFLGTSFDDITEVKQMLREEFRLDVYQRGAYRDLFSAVALVAYKSAKISSTTKDDMPFDERIGLAAEQLRAVTASQMAYHYRTDERSQSASEHLGEPVQDYINRLKDEGYRGDLLCLFFLSQYFQRAFRVWVPGVGSIIYPGGPARHGIRTACAFQLLLSAEPPDDKPPAKTYCPTWLPVQTMRSAKTRVRFAAADSIYDLPMTDDDIASRITTDPEPLAAMLGRNKRPRS